MNTPSPLVPQGSFLEQRNQGRARVKIAVFVVLAIHGIGLLALLMQGCKKEPDTGAMPETEAANTNTAPAFLEPTNTVAATSNLETAPPTNVTAPEPTAPTTPTVPEPVATTTDYKVMKGDTFSGIAKKFHVTTRAIQDANPGVDATKLQIGQTIHIPPAAATATAPSGTTGSGAQTATGEQVYTVVSGDTLTGIASKFKVSIRALRSLNNLQTDRIRVGQKLKIPAGATASGGTNSSGSPATGQ